MIYKKILAALFIIAAANVLFAGENNTSPNIEQSIAERFSVKPNDRMTIKFHSFYFYLYKHKILNFEYSYEEVEFLFKAVGGEALELYKNSIKKLKSSDAKTYQLFTRQAVSAFNNFLAASDENREIIKLALLKKEAAKIRAEQREQREQENFLKHAKNRKLILLGLNAGMYFPSSSSGYGGDIAMGVTGGLQFMHFLNNPFESTNYGYLIGINYFSLSSTSSNENADKPAYIQPQAAFAIKYGSYKHSVLLGAGVDFYIASRSLNQHESFAVGAVLFLEYLRVWSDISGALSIGMTVKAFKLNKNSGFSAWIGGGIRILFNLD